ncbi:MAG: hypothetical protein GKR95_09510 [Gammaproteobacteria bacterium]|nr:hypothetical protein [Gammaproteobacteria bacterium]
MTASPLNVGLLLCDDVPESAQEEYGTYGELFQKSIDDSASEIQLTAIHCHKGETLPAPEDFDGYVITGSKYAVYEDIPWILDLQGFVRKCWDQNIRMVGICFGHQLIAHSLGGKTEKADVGWGFGIHAAKVTQPQPWMNNRETLRGDQYRLIVIHQDQVVKVPPEFKTVAENDFCPNSMIVAEDRMLGIQGHPEFNKEYCEFRATSRRELIGEEVYQATLESLASQETNSNTVLGWIRNFLTAERV